MQNCPKCNQALIQPLPEAANDNAGIIYVKDNRALLRPNNISRIAKEIAAVPVSSRELINWLADTLFIEFEGVLLWPNNKSFEISDDDLDRVFENKTASRWLRSMRQFADRPVQQAGQLVLAERYRLLDTALQIQTFNAAEKRI